MSRRRNKPTDVFVYIAVSEDITVCWPWTGSLNDKGRPYFKVNGRSILAYRLVKSLVDSTFDINDQSQKILHQCDNEICCNPHHLEVGTHEKNMAEMRERERHGLPHHTVKAIRRLLAMDNAFTHQQIADKFGVSRQTIGDIANYRTYQNITGGNAGDNGEIKTENDRTFIETECIIPLIVEEGDYQ